MVILIKNRSLNELRGVIQKSVYERIKPYKNIWNNHNQIYNCVSRCYVLEFATKSTILFQTS